MERRINIKGVAECIRTCNQTGNEKGQVTESGNHVAVF